MEETEQETIKSQSTDSEQSNNQEFTSFPIMNIECILSELSSAVDNMRLEAASENIKLKVNSNKIIKRR